MSVLPSMGRACALITLFGLVLAAASCSGGGSDSGSAGAPGGVGELTQLVGRIVNGQGVPIDGAVVEVNSAPPITLVTGANGSFQFDLEEGAYELTVRLNGQSVYMATVALAGGAGVTDLGDLQVTSSVLGVIVGGEQNPLDGAMVAIDSTPVFTQQTGTDGQFLAELPTGNYTVTIQWNGQQVVQIPISVTLPGPVDLGLIQILNQVGGRIVDGLLAPIDGAIVTLDTMPPTYIVTGADGIFETEVPEGIYQMQVRVNGVVVHDDALPVTLGNPIDLGFLQVLARASGRIVDMQQTPVSGAQLSVTTTPPLTATSASDGTFSFDIPIASHQLEVRLFGVAVAQMVLIPTAGTGLYYLGDIVVSSGADTDGDGISDGLEFNGWDILLDNLGDGTITTVHVTSDPNNVDTDGDTLTDDVEFGLRINPNVADTDGDLLSDADEVLLYRSLANSVDSDGDARDLDSTGNPVGLPNASLFDGAEVMYSKTSPILADTDGDSFRDYDEILGGGMRPLVADQPIINIDVIGDPSVSLNATFTSGTTTSATDRTLQRDEGTQSTTDSTTIKDTTENTEKITASADSALSFKVEGSMEWKQSSMNEHVVGFTNQSAMEMQNELTTNTGSETNISYSDATLGVALRVTNTSNLAVKVQDMTVLAYRVRSTAGAGALELIGTLTEFQSSTFSGGGVILPPGGSFTFEARNDQLNYQPLLAFIENPGNLLFEVGSYKILKVDSQGNTTGDYDAIAERVVERCANVIIDFGDGNIELYAVAANLLREPDGSAAGITMGEVLNEVLQIPFETVVAGAPATPPAPGIADPTGRRVLTKVRDREYLPNTPTKRRWLVMGADVTETIGGQEYFRNFDEIVIKPGQRIELVYLIDDDEDGLIGTEETLFGTSLQDCDTDLDGLGDFFEAKIGWDIVFSQCGEPGITFPQYTYTTFPNPRLADTDLDGLTDFEEVPAGQPAAEYLLCPPGAGQLTSNLVGIGTDPTRRDTDAWDYQGLDDANDQCPLDPPALTSPVSNQDLEVYYRFDPSENLTVGTLLQTRDRSGNSNHGCMEESFVPLAFDPMTITGAISLWPDRRGFINKAFWFDQDPGLANFAYIEILPRPTLPPPSQTWTWAFWLYLGDDTRDQTIIEQQGWAAIRFRAADKSLRFELHDASGNPLQPPSYSLAHLAGGAVDPVPVGAWRFYCVTVDYDPQLSGDPTTISLYGAPDPYAQAQALSDNSATWPAALINPSTTGTPTPVHIGAAFRPDGSIASNMGLDGAVDDFRQYSRALTLTEVDALYLEHAPIAPRIALDQPGKAPSQPRPTADRSR